MTGKFTTLIILFSLVIINGKVNAQFLYDSVSFETATSKIILDPATNHTWQIGTPGKIFLDSAHTGTKAILTNTLNSYPAGDTSSFIYVIRNPYTQTCYTSMEFWHKYDTDTLADYGNIEASYDGGNSWVVVNDTNNVSLLGSFFWWDDDYHASDARYTDHPIFTSGKSDGWIMSRFNWRWWIPVKSDTIIYPIDSLMIRFTFISDPVQTDRDGWMIDDILTSSAGWQLCSEIPEAPGGGSIYAYPNPFSRQTKIESVTEFNDAEITMYNSAGLKVKQISQVTGKSLFITRNGLPPGLYYLVISENNKIIGNVRLMIND